MPPLSPESALALLYRDKANYDGMHAHLRFLAEHRRAWLAGERRVLAGERAAAVELSALLGDTPAPMLCYVLSDLWEALRDPEQGLFWACRAAALSPPWDPLWLAWGHNAIAGQLEALGRIDEARDVLCALWAHEPFYANGRATAVSMGLTPPDVPTRDEHLSDSLRLAGHHTLFQGDRAPGARATAMATSLFWSRDYAASLVLAERADEGMDVAWGQAIAKAARSRADHPGAVLPVVEPSARARQALVKPAVKAKDRKTLEALALDVDSDVLLAAWKGLLTLDKGHRVGGLVLELDDVLADENSMLSVDVAALAARVDRPEVADVPALVRRVIDAVRGGSLCMLPDQGPQSLAFDPLPPSLAAWLAFGGLNASEVAGLGEVASRAFGDHFAGLPETLALAPCLPLDLPELAGETLAVLLLTHPDARGETPVLYLDVSESPVVEIAATSFGEWLAADVGVGRAANPQGSAMKAVAKRVFGRARTTLAMI